MALLTIFLSVIVICLFLFNLLKRPNNFPPGPQWLPIVGNFLQLKQLTKQLGYLHLTLSYLAKKYRTPVLGLKLGSDLVVVIFTYDVVREVFTRSEFEGRPDTFFIRLRSMGTRKGITCTEGPLWQEHRNFVTRHLRQLGYGKQLMEEMIVDELKEVLMQFATEPCGMTLVNWFAPSVLNILWGLTAGSRFAPKDPRLVGLLKLLEVRSKAFDMAGGTLSQFPWLRHIAPEGSGYNLLLQLNTDLNNILMETIEEHRQSHGTGQRTDLIDAFLTEMEAKDGQVSTFTDDQLMMICLDLFIAGSQTTSNTLAFAFLVVLLHPSVQSKVYEEVRDVVGKDQLPSLTHRPKMPYTEAVLTEVQRLYQVTPVGGPRRVLKDTKLQGYNLPEDTTVLISLWSVHMDPDHWEQPEEFRPDRFLNKHGQLQGDDWLFSYGLGKRRCLGEALARGCIFLFFTGILQRFRVCSVPGEELPSNKPVPGLTLSPPPYRVLLVPRE